jgi:peptide/nickel transport system ATP-binding protein
MSKLPDTPLLAVRNLRVEFPTRTGVLVPVNEVSFSLNAGEVLGIVGESGAGKSMMGGAIIGLLDPPGRVAGGEILLEGERIDNLDHSALSKIRGRKIGFVPQDPLTSLNPLFTVGQQLIQTIRAHRALSKSAARHRAIELLTEVGIPAPDRRIDQYPHQFSGGMRQRVVIALALCAGPKLVIADEPTTALDVSIQAQIIDVLKRMCRDYGASIILITHDMGVIADTADRVGVMYAGRLVEIGPVRKVVREPVHPYTKGLMASIPVVGRKQERLTQITGAMPRLTEIPTGCAFHPRCPKAFERCHRDRPDLVPVEASEAACWLYQEHLNG